VHCKLFLLGEYPRSLIARRSYGTSAASLAITTSQQELLSGKPEIIDDGLSPERERGWQGECRGGVKVESRRQPDEYVDDGDYGDTDSRLHVMHTHYQTSAV